MTQTQVGASGLVRVTIASGRRRVDLVLPAAVPVAELVPELARSVGLLDGATVYGGYAVVTQDGRVLAHDAGLTIQGVEDGSLLTVSAGVDQTPPRVYDDVVEAMTDVVEKELRPWEPAAGRRTALGASALLLLVGAYSLLLQTDQTLGAVGAGVVAVLLSAAAIVLSRVQRERQAAVVLGTVAAVYGGVAGALVGRDEVLLGLGGTYVGAGVVLAALVVVVGIEDGRPLLVPPIFVGGVLAVCGWLFDVTDLSPASVLASLLVLVVVAGSVFPWLALSATATRVDQLASIEDIEATPGDIDADKVLADARAAHEILVGLTVAVGVLLVLVAPLAVSLGAVGTVLVLLCSAIIMLRTRQYRTGTEVLAGLVSGIAALLVIGLSVLVLHPDWRPVAAVGLAVAGGLVLVGTLVPGSTSIRRARVGDVVETIALVALFPVLAVAVNLFGRFGG
ncbi:type VII secretion integral membrane protein EccD [Nocardioides zeae]|uniref:Type VII secretion integral membrane protein EccD n=1 Tax=Nocardioides imazamoxiresistens TaxID=3231893 RepID=A0ABU3PW45_9ACTN|nr:type VII secretion integral membrane protein EccD [Nocardioides zeae]MDT9593447.1 type VII secretion integral membrane protein EccD [Nocardioides zeae]